MKKITRIEQLQEQNWLKWEDVEKMEEVVKTFSLAVTPQMTQLIESEEDTGPIYRQFIPRVEELNILPEERSDPIGDNPYTVLKGLVHRYPDRCLLMPVTVCSVYCRFCFRREKVGSGAKILTKEERHKAYAYIARHKDISEVILTGGDPLILNPASLAEIMQALACIDHVEVIRIHTRIPIVDSLRITEEMIKALDVPKAVYLAIHANHGREFTDLAKEACLKIAKAGITMVSQTVLLKGINDDPLVLADLMKAFVRNRIKPYYLHHPDLAQGTSHFRVSIKEGKKIVAALRGRLSGLCQPTYVLDIPGGFGKVPINEDYVTLHDDRYCIKDYQGMMHEYIELLP